MELKKILEKLVYFKTACFTFLFESYFLKRYIIF